MTDRELLELAAKAAGHKIVWGEVHRVGDTDVDCTDLAYVLSDSPDESPSYWNPLTEDGDALRLAVKLGINVGFGANLATVVTTAYDWSEDEVAVELTVDARDNELAATRRAIVMAAAELGRQS